MIPESLSESLTDEQVVERVRAGETALYEILMRRHNQRVYRAARSVVHDESEAEDVMQEAYVRAFRNLGQFQGRARFSTWLTRIAVHEALARKRRNARFVSMDSDSPEMPAMIPNAVDRDSPDVYTERRELGALLARAVDGLPENLRLVYVMRDVEGLSTGEAAAVLDLSEANVKVRLHRARRSLRRALEGALDESSRDLFTFHLRRCDRIVAAVLARIMDT